MCTAAVMQRITQAAKLRERLASDEGLRWHGLPMCERAVRRPIRLLALEVCTIDSQANH